MAELPQFKCLDCFWGNGAWKQRVIQDAETSETLYYCDIKTKFSGYSISFHKTSKRGPLLATGVNKIFRSGARISFQDEREIIIEPRRLLGLSPRSYFRWDSQRYNWKPRYNWKGGIKLFKLKSERGVVIAQFKNAESTIHDGTLEIYHVGSQLVDVVVMTFLMYLFRIQFEERVSKEIMDVTDALNTVTTNVTAMVLASNNPSS